MARDYCLTELGQARAAEYRRAAYWAVGPWLKSYPRLADAMRDAATDGLIDFAAHYDPSRAKGMTYLVRCVRQRCLDVLRNARRPSRFITAPAQLSEDFDTPAPAPADPDVCSADWVDDLLSCLPARDAELVRSCVVDGETKAAAAGRLGRDKSHACRSVAASLALLREHLVVRPMAS